MNASFIAQEFELSAFLSELEADPIAAARSLRKAAGQIVRSYHENLRQMLGAAYGLATKLNEEPQLLDRFCKDPKLEAGSRYTLKRETTADVLRLVCRVVFKGTGQSRCNRYARGLALLSREGTPVKAVPDQIKERGGIDKLSKAAKRKKSTRSVDDERNDAWNDEDELDEGPARKKRVSKREALKLDDPQIKWSRKDLVKLCAVKRRSWVKVRLESKGEKNGRPRFEVIAVVVSRST